MRTAIFGLLSLLITFFAINNPYHNWDMIGYFASAESYKYDDKNRIHSKTYSELQSYVSEKKFQSLTTSTYRESIFTSPELLKQQLPYYQIRVLYISLINFLTSINLHPYFSMHFISAISTFMGLMLISSLLFNKLKLPLVFSLLPTILASLGLLSIARYSTPDGQAFLFSTVILYLFLSKKYLTVLFTLPLLVLVRTDLIILIVSFSLYYVIINREHLYKYLGSLIVSLGIYFGINSYFGNYGWHTIFYMTLVEHVINPAEVSPMVNFQNYISAFTKGFLEAFKDYSFLIYFCNSIILFFHHRKIYLFSEVFRCPEKYSLEIIHYINLAYFVGHFILFPLVLERFFATQYAFTFILFSMLIYRLKKVKVSCPAQ